MRKCLLIFAIIFVSLLAFTIWRAQPPFHLNRKLLASLPYAPDTLLVTDLDDDEHPEVMALTTANKPPIWVRFPFDKPSRLRFENGWVIWMEMKRCHFVLKALPVLTSDNRLQLLRWKGGRATLDPLPNLPDVPAIYAAIYEGEVTGTIFLRVHRGNDDLVFTLTPQGNWQFASQITSQGIEDIADLDRDGLLDALCVQEYPDKFAWVSWGGRKREETNLGIWVHYGYPQIADLGGDGWKEIMMVAKDKRLKIWRFDRRERRLKVIATSPPLPVTRTAFSMHLFDLDGDGQKEIVVIDAGGNYWGFQLRDGKLKMWQCKMGLRVEMWRLGQVKFGDQLALYTYQYRPVWLFPPRIWMEGGKLQRQFREELLFTVFALLPKGKQALSPSNWRIQGAL